PATTDDDHARSCGAAGSASWSPTPTRSHLLLCSLRRHSCGTRSNGLSRIRGDGTSPHLRVLMRPGDGRGPRPLYQCGDGLQGGPAGPGAGAGRAAAVNLSTHLAMLASLVGQDLAAVVRLVAARPGPILVQIGHA